MMPSRGMLSLLVGLAFAAACTDDGEGPVPAFSPPAFPTVQPGERCPTSELRPTSPDFAPGLGDGPAYPLGFDVDGKLLVELPPFAPSHQFAGSGWGGQKVLWVVDPAYSGPIRVRGQRLDATGEMRFDLDLVPELTLAATGSQGASGWRERPSYTRVQRPGCYAYRVDGKGFSDVIVFEAVPSREECTAGRVRRLVRAFAGAFNRGKARALDLSFAAEPEFRWYSTQAPGERIGGNAAERDTLLQYFANRYRRGERLELRSVRFNGNGEGYGHFDFRLVRRADDLEPTRLMGKGAAICFHEEDVIAVWSMGHQ
jgi:hypothetical protein